MSAPAAGRKLANSALVALLVLVSACGTDRETETPGTSPRDASKDSAKDGDAHLAPLPEITCTPALQSIDSDIFKRTCALTTCHTPDGFAGSLDLSGTDVESQLVDRDAITCRGWKRVVPGAPEASLLWNKINSDTPACGPRMPWNFVRLPQNALDCVRNWILALPAKADAATDGPVPDANRDGP